MGGLLRTATAVEWGLTGLRKPAVCAAEGGAGGVSGSQTLDTELDTELATLLECGLALFRLCPCPTSLLLM